MRLKRIQPLYLVFPMSTLFFLMSTSFFPVLRVSGMQNHSYQHILSSGTVDYPHLPEPDGDYPPIKVWSNNSYWYKKISKNAPLHPNSAQMVNWLVNEDGHHGGYPNIQYKSWTNPIYDAYQDTPIYAVYNKDKSKYYDVRIPAGATPSQEADGNLIIIDWYGKKVWEFWQFNYEEGQYYAGAMYGYDLYSDGVVAEGVWTCGGSGTPDVATHIRPEEIEAGVINHPLGCALHSPKIHKRVYPPASTADGRSTDPYAIPEGARIQLDPNLDLDSLGLSRTAKIIAKCMQDYGMVVTQSGGSWHLYAEHTFTANWGPEVSGDIMSGLGDLVTSSYNPWRIVDYSVFGAAEKDFPSYP